MEWFDAHARALPWREPGTSAYGVLVSEVMSQQTPVARVEPAWREWMRRWPDPASLAAADPAQVLVVWGRLGYPRRALRLIEAARAVVERHGGQVPRSRAELEALPGVGHYTAGAVLAFAYGQRALALDTNVRRVLARAVDGAAAPRPSVSVAERERAQALMPPAVEEAGDAHAAQAGGRCHASEGSSGDSSGAGSGAPEGRARAARGPDPARWMAGVMELGALVCTARAPRHEACPWRGRCAWLARGCPPDEDAGRRRRQAWEGTDRQARGRVMAVLREAGPGVVVPRTRLEEAAASVGADPDQPRRALEGLVADGLAVVDGQGLRLP